MTGQLRATADLMALLTASGTTINARLARMAADPGAIAGDPETLRMVSEKLSAVGESAAKAWSSAPEWATAWQRWWWSRAFSFGPDAMMQADRRLLSDLSGTMQRASAAMQTPFRTRAVANARRLSR